MELKYAHLCDYAGEAAHGKVIAIGIFHTVFASPVRPIVMPTMYLLVAVEAHVSEGTEHTMELRFTDDEGADMMPRVRGPMRFIPQGPDRPLLAHIIVHLQSIPLADTGDFEFYVLVDDRSLGSIPLAVRPIPNIPR